MRPAPGWAADRSAEELAEPFTFVVSPGRALRLAPRRSGHVACAGGEPAPGAGEIGFRRSGDGGEVGTVGNHSTGCCPDTASWLDTASWPAVTAALARLGSPHPEAFTHLAVFTHPVVVRRRPRCARCHLVREEHYARVFYDADLPRHWNVDQVALPERARASGHGRPTLRREPRRGHAGDVGAGR
ncbi:hypothetical protein ACWD4P_09200 [Kitasatospora sp. NPDC002543]